jgi:hypothetical protein
MQIKTKDIPIDLENPFKHDLLDRKTEIENISSIVTSISAPLVMSIDSPWGTGKTTFIKMWRAHLESQGVTSIYFNAWESDYAEDPLVALVAELDRWVKTLDNPSLTEGAWKKAKSLLPGIAKSAAVTAAKIATFGGLDIEKEYEKVTADFVGGTVNDLVDSFNVQSSAIHQFKEIVENTISVLGDEQKNLLIFVDELDRCRPTYAIELLERIKHLFNIDRIVFVLSTDIEQLSHSICAVYGNNFNARSYLQRFIDIDYSLKEPENKSYIISLIHSLSIDDYFSNRREGRYEEEHLVDCCNIFSTRFDLSLRGINLLLTRVRLILSSVPSNQYLYEPLLISLVVMREHNPELYTRYINDPKIADEVIDYLAKDLPSSDLNSFPFSLISGYLIAPNLDFSNDSRFKELLAPYEKIIADESHKNSDLGYAADKVIRIAGSTNGMGRSVNLKTCTERIELLHRIKIEQ